MKLLAVPPNMAAHMPGVVWQHVDSAINRVGLSDPKSVQFDVFSGAAVLWIAVDESNQIVGAGVTQLEESQGRRICVIVAWGADDQAKCQPLLDVIDDYARAEDCAAVRFYGREGWRRVLGKFDLKAVIMEKAL